MQDANGTSWIREVHVSAEMLESVRGLNRRFLDLAAVPRLDGSPGGWAVTSAPALSMSVAAQIAPLSTAQKAAAASCPYALFDLRFCDEVHWRSRFDDSARWRVADDAPVLADTLDFVRTALFFAWHVACAGKVAAQWLLGMNEVTAAAFRATSIDRMPAVAATEAVHLSARWNDCPAYWSALAQAASGPDPAGLRKIQLYGLQLTAAARLG
jgi:hypothetical protein